MPRRVTSTEQPDAARPRRVTSTEESDAARPRRVASTEESDATRNAPRLEIDLDKIGHNARALRTLFGARGVSVTAVTKGVLGSPAVAEVLVDSGITAIGSSRIENIRRMKEAGIEAEFTLIRTPMLSRARQVVQYADVSLNTELSVIKLLSEHAARLGKRHGIILMVELGDLREGILPSELGPVLEGTLELEGVELVGIGTNLACYSGVKPTDKNMGELSAIAERVRRDYGIPLEVVSGGNSANYQWLVSTPHVGLVNNLRIGEAILLGRETLHRASIPGLHTDAITLVAEVIELRTKPSAPAGESCQDAFGSIPVFEDRGVVRKALLAIGKQDVDVSGIRPRIDVDVLGGTSDHVVLDAKRADVCVGSEVEFDVNHSALLRAMTSPYISKEYHRAFPRLLPAATASHHGDTSGGVRSGRSGVQDSRR